MEQTTIFEKEQTSSTSFVEMEYQAYLAIEQYLFAVMEEENLPSSAISFPKKEFEKSQYSSVYIFGEANLLCRISFRAKQGYISLPTKYEKYIPDATNYTSSKTDTNYFRISLNNPNDILLYKDLICDVLRETLYSLPTEFGCCSRYEQCSDAKKCINPNPDLVIHCAYRKNLRNGNIFYGKNKTI